MKVKKDVTVRILFTLYMYIVCKVILFKLHSIDVIFLWRQLQNNLANPENMRYRLSSANFTPFKSIASNIEPLSIYNFVNLFGNIAIFIPYGIFLSLLLKNKGISFIGVLVHSLFLSLSLECLQIILSIGSFDVDDLILNTFGGVLGYSVFRLYNMLLKCNYTNYQ